MRSYPPGAFERRRAARNPAPAQARCVSLLQRIVKLLRSVDAIDDDERRLALPMRPHHFGGERLGILRQALSRDRSRIDCCRRFLERLRGGQALLDNRMRAILIR
jgi:hypothetical protein